MAIREDIILDPTKGIKGLDEMNRATVKYARRQEKLYKKNKEDLEAIQTELKRLKAVREKSNNPKAVRKYTNTIEKLEEQQEKLTRETRQYARAVGRADNQAEGFRNTLASIGATAKAAIAGAAASAFVGLSIAIGKAFQIGGKFQQALADLSAITGIEGEALQNISKNAQQLAVRFGQSADTIVEAYKLVAGQVAGSLDFSTQAGQQALDDFTEAAIVLQKAAGTDLQSAVQTTASVVNQFGLEVSDASKVVNILAAASKFGAGEIPYLQQALTQAGTAASVAGVNIRTTSAALEVLAANGQQAGRAGTQLRNIFTILQTSSEKLAKHGIENIDIGANGFVNTLKQLQPILQNTIALEDVFGRENIAAAQILIKNANAVERLQGQLKGTNVAYQQAAKQLDTFLTDLSRLWQSIRNTGVAVFQRFNEVGSGAIEWLMDMVGGFREWIDLDMADRLRNQQVELNILVSQITNANIGQERRNTLLGELQNKYPSFLENLDAESVTTEQLATRLKKVNEQYERRIKLAAQRTRVYELQGSAQETQQGIFDLRSEVIKRLEERDASINTVGKSTRELIVLLREQDTVFNRLGLVAAGYGKRLDEMNNRLQEQQEQIHQEISFLDQLENKYGMTADEAGNMNNEVTAGTATLQEQKETLEMVLGQLEKGTQGWEFYKQKLDEVNKAIGEGRSDGGSPGWMSALKQFGDVQEWLNNIASLNMQTAGGAQLGETLRLVTELDDRLSNFAGGDIAGSITDVAMNKIRQFNAELTRLNNEFKAGIIDQKQYEQQVEKLSNTFLVQLQQMYKTIKDKLSPAQQKLWEQLFGNFEDGQEATKDFQTNLEDIADTADAIINVADAFGAIGDNARKSLRGISDVLRNVQKIKELSAQGALTGLSGALPIIGAAGGVLSILSGTGLFGNSERKEELAELTNSLKSLRRSVDRNTEAFYQASVVGAGSTEEEITRGQELASNILPNFGNVPLVFGITGAAESIRGDLEELGELFPDLFGNALDIFNNLMEQQDFEGAAEFLRGLEDRMRSLADSFGEYGDSVDAAIRIFNDAMTFAGQSASDAIDLFVGKVRELGTAIPAEKLQELENLDISTEEGRARLQEIVQELFQNRDLFRGALSPDEFSSLLDFLESQAEGGGASGSASSDYSRSTQVANTITEVQANELLMFQENQLMALRDLLDAITQGFNSIGGQVKVTPAGTLSSINVPVPQGGGITKEFLNGLVDKVSLPASNIKSGDLIIRIDNVNNIDDLTRRVNQQIREEFRGTRFR